jgi:predicted transcriptional regulator of viral defense system
VVLSFREQGRSVVRVSDVLELLGSENSARKVIRNLVREGWLSRIVGGRYMLLPPEYGPENLGENNILALAAAAAEPSYIGWWSARLLSRLHHAEVDVCFRRCPAPDSCPNH